MLEKYLQGDKTVLKWIHPGMLKIISEGRHIKQEKRKTSSDDETTDSAAKRRISDVTDPDDKNITYKMEGNIKVARGPGIRLSDSLHKIDIASRTIHLRKIESSKSSSGEESSANSRSSKRKRKGNH